MKKTTTCPKCDEMGILILKLVKIISYLVEHQEFLDVSTGDEILHQKARDLRAAGASIRDIAEEVGVPRSTAHRWVSK